MLKPATTDLYLYAYELGTQRTTGVTRINSEFSPPLSRR
jgi:hypothetical protein